MNIGVIGGGQLARMLALAGYPLGLKLICLEPNADCPAGEVTEVIKGDYADPKQLQALADRVDVMTYEFENINLSALAAMTRLPIYPAINALAVAQDRLSEKTFFNQLDIPTTQFAAVNSLEELYSAAAKIGLPAVLKTRRWGYDGKGQVVIQATNELEPAWLQLKHQPLLLENKVAFQREVSCLAVRSTLGETAFYPLVVNQHQAGILRLSQVVAEEDEIAAAARDYVGRILNAWNYVGVLAVEFFQDNGGLFANEIAPRVHNSGHWSIEGAVCSQFENHLRAVAGLPLGATTANGYTAMVNFIGSIPPLATILKLPGVHCHLYGKEARPGRKLGHATICSVDKNRYFQQLQALCGLAGFENSI